MKTIDQILKIEAVVLYVLQAFKEGLIISSSIKSCISPRGNI